MTFWKEVDGWTYEYFERDVAPEALPGFEDVVRLWRDKCGGRPVPAISDFDFADFHGWHGRILLSDLFYDPFDFRYRLFGVEIAERLRVDFTGRRYSRLVAEGLEPAEDLEFYEMTCREMLISRVSGELHWLERKHVTASFVEFPLSDGGGRATHLLGAMI